MNHVSRRDAIIAAASGAVVLGTAGAVGFAAPAPRSPDEQRPRVEHYTTPPDGERVSSILLAHKPYKITTLYSLKLPELRKGDVVQAHCQLETTNDLRYNVMLAHAMLLHRKETLVDHGDRPGGQLLCEYAGENVTPGMHHGFRTLIGSAAVANDGDAWVSVLIYAANYISRPGDKLKVEGGYGGLRAIVFRA